MPTASPHAALAMVAAAMLAALAALVRAGITHELDRIVLRAVQSVASDALGRIGNLHTLVGLPYVTLTIACVLVVALHRRGHGSAALAPLLIAGTLLVELGLKLTTGHAPPSRELTPFDVIPRLETPSSFPSGHAARLTFLSAFAALLASRRIVTLAAAAFVALTLVARVYVGDHWPTDVVGGAALGLAFALPAAAWVRQSAASKSSFARRK